MGKKLSDQEPEWKHAVAGATAGLATVLALHPLDVVKTRLQVQDGAQAYAYAGARDAFRKILAGEGWCSLYAGLAPSLVGSGVAWGVYFYAYNAAKARFRRTGAAPAEARLSAAQHMRAAAEAGAIVCLATNPLWVAKTRLQLQQRVALTGGAAAAGAAGACAARAAAAGAAAGAYAGLADCLVTIARTEGVRGLYKGLLPSMLLVSHGVIQFVAYEELKALAGRGAFDGFTRALGGGGGASSGGARGGAKGGAKGGKGSANCAQRREPTHAEVTAFGALSKLAASVVTYPSQVLRARLQQRMDGRDLVYTGAGDALRKTLSREGVTGLYKGLGPHALRVMPQSALTFLVYETVLRQLGGGGTDDAEGAV